MLSFFRKLRQSLLGEAQMSRYLVYAIGEIVLVVLGILIAVRINNWNQERAQYKELQASFHKLYLDLDTDLDNLLLLDSIYTARQASAEAMQALLLRENNMDDLLEMRQLPRLSNRNLSQNNGTYLSLINTGLLYKSGRENLNKSINYYYKRMEVFEVLFNQMGESNREVRDAEVLFPFQFILSTDDKIFSAQPSALKWMNDPEDPTYQGAQYYLALYVRQQETRLGVIEELIQLNQALQKAILPLIKIEENE